MRAYECLLSAEAKTALLEILMATKRPVRIQRAGDREEWRVGGRTRYEWRIFHKEADSDSWSAQFGGNLKTPEILEPLFARTVSTHRGCSWVWPARTDAP